MVEQWSPKNVWVLGLSCKINHSRVPGSCRVWISDFPDPDPGPAWSWHIKMFMRSLAMSSIQPLGHKLPKALNLIHKDIRQLLSNAWYFISIVMTREQWLHQYNVSSELENKKGQARQEISASCLFVCDTASQVYKDLIGSGRSRQWRVPRLKTHSLF